MRVRFLLVVPTDLGPVGTPLSALAAFYSSALGSAAALTFSATSCYVPAGASSVSIVCRTVPGAGFGLQVMVSVGGQTAVSGSKTIAYRPPIMYALSGRGFTNAETVGGQPVLITGDQFGPVSMLGGVFSPLPNVTAAYGQPSDVSLRYTAASCAVTTAQTVITCYTAPGVGFGHIWQVTVAGQAAPRLPSYLSESAHVDKRATVIFVVLQASRLTPPSRTRALSVLCCSELRPSGDSDLFWRRRRACKYDRRTARCHRRRQLRSCWNAYRHGYLRCQRHGHCRPELHPCHSAHGGA
jgi:hypothetical protein